MKKSSRPQRESTLLTLLRNKETTLRGKFSKRNLVNPAKNTKVDNLG